MTAGRPKLTRRKVKWKVGIYEDLAAKVELFMLHPLKNTVKYGARDRLLNELLEQWLTNKMEEFADGRRHKNTL